MPPLAPGETVLLVDRRDKRYVVRLLPGAVYHFHGGQVPHDALIGAEEGVEVTSSKGYKLVAYRPRLIDHIMQMPRHSAIIYPKDLGPILLWADIYPGATVFESGIGSGALTLALLRAVGPTGRVIVYERRADFIAAARANIAAFYGEPPNLLVHQRDTYEGIAERDLDRVLLDLPEPWLAVPAAAAALRPGGFLCAYTPSTTQVQAVVQALRAHGFGDIETFETLHRPWHVQGQSVRPAQQMVGHTGFLTFARRLSAPLAPEVGAAVAAAPGEPSESEDEAALGLA
ncbi:MAG TPA: tRNA (adenine-N1)-methyltransferase [Chloroflexota bacterium]|jgi:tRNA (adenine57-N1/adenine58-N1)-methyltransferase|nr:tRNA (adenine-N1)-methyltransferase [Chloroflexota bacterium]